MNKPARRRSSYKKILEQQQQQESSSPPPAAAAASSSSTNRNKNTASATKNNNSNIMDGAHRKIELQSPEDLTYLITNVRRAATEHVTAAFPPVDGEDDAAAEDELRVRIEKLVNDYISQTFTLAAPNLSINGFDLDQSTFPAVYLSNPTTTTTTTDPTAEIQYEPFDARKRARVEELAREEEDLMREIAALKRKVPAAAAGAYVEGFWAGVKADGEALARVREDDTVSDGAKSKLLLDGVAGPLERQVDVEATYAGVVDSLGRLKRDMPSTVAKMERARVAGEYVVTER